MRCNVRHRKEVINTSCVDMKKEYYYTGAIP